ncbi:SET and MYND domain-containing protein 4-like [Anopheles marshallii]|uniref:SET and MYND domain-containing protein 4-like n=1 Tax=Anopheles marshallii TaxID=1521116 RepID=UPI00237BF83A|nr:SET and MYND domain-containing protein 4-like [Anopheles marshallii]
MEAENPPTIVESRSCRTDKKLVAFIIEKEMRLDEPTDQDNPFWCNIIGNINALRLYDEYEGRRRYIGINSDSRKLERLNLMIAYVLPNSYLLKAAYACRAFIAYNTLEDFYCMYNIMHVQEIIPYSNDSVKSWCKYMLDNAFNRRLGEEYPHPHKDPKTPKCFSYVSCEDSVNYGRHLHSRRTLVRGSTVLQELPFVSLLLPVDRWMRCHKCLIHTPLVLIPCPSCSVMLYCSHTCRIRAYEEYHSLECAMISYLISKYEPTEILALRLTIRVFKMFHEMPDVLNLYIRTLSENMAVHEYNKPNGYDLNAEADYKKVYRLATNRRHLTRAQLTANGLRAVAMSKLLVTAHNLPLSFVELLAELTLRHMHIVRVNALVLHRSVDDPAKDCFDATSVPYALTLLTTGSMFNHSCNANVEYSLSKYGTIKFVANRFISNGAMLHINYRCVRTTDLRIWNPDAPSSHRKLDMSCHNMAVMIR